MLENHVNVIENNSRYIIEQCYALLDEMRELGLIDDKSPLREQIINVADSATIISSYADAIKRA